MPRIQFVGQSARDDDNRQGNTSRLLNIYREPLGQGGKATHALKSVLGTELLASVNTLFFRDMKEISGQLYAMFGDRLVNVRANGSVTDLGVTVSAEGAQIFGAEFDRVCTVSGGRYFVWDGTTMLEPTPGAFSDFGSGAFFGNYVLLSERNGRRVQWSSLADATDLPGLNFATAESTDKPILRIVPLQGRVMLMKEDVTEIWYETGGLGPLAFARLSGGVQEVGLKAPSLVTRFTGGVFFVGSDNIAYITNGGQFQPISGPAVNTSISQSQPTECFTYEDEGHIFCVIRYDDRPSWVYDIATGEWHERATGAEGPWIARGTVEAYGHWHAADNLGNIYRLLRNNKDGNQPLIRTAISASAYNEGKRFRVPLVEFTGRMGRGLDGAQGTRTTLRFPDGRDYDPVPDDLTMDDDAITLDTQTYLDEPSILVQFSGDGGNTWTRHRRRDLGALGEYGALCRIRNAGSFRQLACKVILSAPKDVTMDADVNVVFA